MHEGNNMGIMTTLKKPTLERGAGGASGHGASGSRGAHDPAQPNHAGHHYVCLGIASARSASFNYGMQATAYDSHR